MTTIQLGNNLYIAQDVRSYWYGVVAQPGTAPVLNAANFVCEVLSQNNRFPKGSPGSNPGNAVHSSAVVRDNENHFGGFGTEGSEVGIRVTALKFLWLLPSKASAASVDKAAALCGNLGHHRVIYKYEKFKYN